MIDFNEQFIETLRNHKLEAGAEEALDRISTGSDDKIIEFAETGFGLLTPGTNPVSLFKSLVAIYKSVKGYGQLYNIKKYLQLFVRINMASRNDIEALLEKLDSDHLFKENFCATVCLTVERVTVGEKVQVISNLIIAHSSGKISQTQFFKMMHLVDSLSWYHLYEIYLGEVWIGEMDSEDQNIKSTIDTQARTSMMQLYGLCTIERIIQQKANDNRIQTLRGSTRSTYQEKVHLTKFGIAFLMAAFRGFKYPLKGSEFFNQILGRSK